METYNIDLDGAIETCGITTTRPMVLTQKPAMVIWQEIGTILKEPHDVLVRIDDETIDRRYGEFGALAKRLVACVNMAREG